MIKELFVRKQKISATEIASTIFDRFFREEIRHFYIRIRKDISNVRKEKLLLTIIALYVFIIEDSTAGVYGNSRYRNKILKAFYALIKKEYKENFNFIIELSQKFSDAYYKTPEDPLFGLGMCFSKTINVNSGYLNLLTAMTGTTETAKKSRMIKRYYLQINGYKIY
jgi:hypothetical protein